METYWGFGGGGARIKIEQSSVILEMKKNTLYNINLMIWENKIFLKIC